MNDTLFERFFDLIQIIIQTVIQIFINNCPYLYVIPPFPFVNIQNNRKIVILLKGSSSAEIFDLCRNIPSVLNEDDLLYLHCYTCYGNVHLDEETGQLLQWSMDIPLEISPIIVNNQFRIPPTFNSFLVRSMFPVEISLVHSDEQTLSETLRTEMDIMMSLMIMLHPHRTHQGRRHSTALIMRLR